MSPPALEPVEDWRDEAPYAALVEADRSAFAWEWLRRDPHYRLAAMKSLFAAAPPSEAGEFPQVVNEAARWGLHAFEAPSLRVPLARPLWLARHDPSVLRVQATRSRGDAANEFDLSGVARLVTLVVGAKGEHLLLSDGFRSLRIDVVTGTLRAGPVLLSYSLSGFAAANAPLLTLRRLLALQKAGRFSRMIHPRERRARRWAMMLRVHDAIAGGASQRDIAQSLFSSRNGSMRWRVEAPTERLRVQRLVRAARGMVGGRYLAFFAMPG